MEELAPLDMPESPSDIKQELNVFVGGARDGTNLHSPGGVTYPSSSRIVALSIGQLGCPLFDSKRSTFRIHSENGAEKGDGSEPPVRFWYEGREHSLLRLGPLSLDFEATKKHRKAAQGGVSKTTDVLWVHAVNAGSLRLETGRHKVELIDVN